MSTRPTVAERFAHAPSGVFFVKLLMLDPDELPVYLHMPITPERYQIAGADRVVRHFAACHACDEHGAFVYQEVNP